MMTMTWRVSSGELRTGIRWVMGGFEPLIMATIRQNPMAIRAMEGAIW